MEEELIIYIRANEESIYANYFREDQPHFNEELIDYIINKFPNAKERHVILEFHGLNIEKNELHECLYNTFHDRLIYNERINKKNIRNTLALYFAGALFGLIAVLLAKNFAYISSFIGVIVSLFIWTGSEIYFFDNTQIRKDMHICNNLLNSTIVLK